MSAPVVSVALIDGVDVDAVAAAVTACPGVSGLFGGRGDAIASYLPGRRVPGVQVSSTTVDITVRSRWDATAADLLHQISRAVSPLLHGQHLAVVIADIDDADPPQLPAPPATATRPVAVQPTPSPAAPIVKPP